VIDNGKKVPFTEGMVLNWLWTTKQSWMKDLFILV
jgi:hypothetical protein